MGGGGQSSSSTASQPMFNWGTFGKGLQTAGATYASSALQQNYMTGGGFQPASMQQAKPFDVNDQASVIQPSKNDAELQAFIDALRRLSESGKSAASYYYVDPRAQGYGAGAGILQAGTQPSF